MTNVYECPLASQVKNVVAIIVSYNDSEAVIKCVEALRKQVVSIIVVDNGSQSAHKRILQTLEEIECLTLIYSSTNLGIGAAVNLALDTLDDTKVDWVLTMDQDSIAAPNMVESMVQLASEFPKAVFTPLIVDIGHSDKYTTPVEVDYAITSGNLIPLTAVRQINGLDPKLFIDGVDFDFSLRLRAEGYRIIRVPAANMMHTLGSANPEKQQKRFYTDHTPLRRYYMARNMILNFRRHFFHFPFFMLRLVFVVLLTFLNVMIWSPRRIESMMMIFRGFIDGLLNRSGEYVNDSSH
ncbi:MAG: rhamnosyltransferase [Pseudomonadota bacterium]|jgi:rhamnosyltransferase